MVIFRRIKRITYQSGYAVIESYPNEYSCYSLGDRIIY